MSGKKLQVVLATRNKGKIRELAEPLAEMGVEVLGLDRFPGIGEIPENGSTFAENALVKAGTVADYTGLISVADDSGLEVDALGGEDLRGLDGKGDFAAGGNDLVISLLFAFIDDVGTLGDASD